MIISRVAGSESLGDTPGFPSGGDGGARSPYPMDCQLLRDDGNPDGRSASLGVNLKRRCFGRPLLRPGNCIFHSTTSPLRINADA